MQGLLIIAAFAFQPFETGLVVDCVDCIEVNHFHDDSCRLVFDQTLYWRYDHDKARHVCEAWRLVKSPDIVPQYDYLRREWRATWFDGETLRQVQSPHARRTWTQYDPELVDREHWDKDRRRNLAKPGRF